MSESGDSVGIWFNPGGVFNSVFAVTGEGIVYTSGKAETIQDAHAVLAKEKSLKAIAYGDMTAVRTNARNSEVRVRIGSGRNAKNIDLELPDDAAQSEFFDAVHARLGSAWTRRSVEVSRIKAAMGPLIAVVIIGFLTYFGYGGAQNLAEGGEAEIRGRRQFIKRIFVWLMDTLGPTGIVIVGGVLLLIAIAVLVHRLRTPPAYEELSRAPSAS